MNDWKVRATFFLIHLRKGLVNYNLMTFIYVINFRYMQMFFVLVQNSIVSCLQSS